MKRIRISVCMATYNGAKYIQNQLQSIIAQLSQNDEIIISDDGSTDRTLEIVASFNDPRIKVFHHVKTNFAGGNFLHKLVSSNFENALMHASGKYIFLSDQDDVWPSNRVISVIDCLSVYDLVYCNFSIIDEHEQLIKKYGFTHKPINRSFVYNVYKMPFYGCCMAFRYDLLKYILPFPKKLVLHDNWIGFLAMRFGKIVYLHEPLHKYRIHSSNTSYTNGESRNSLLNKIYYRIVFIFQLSCRIIEKLIK